MKEEDIAAGVHGYSGNTACKERLNIMIHDIIENSQDKPEICMSPDVEEAMRGLRSWMFEHVLP